jgi:predicted nucleotidyltransferase
MPVRSLTSPVLKWPDHQTVVQALRLWAEKVGQARSDVVGIGYFGSYARGDWGVGSDLDVVIIVAASHQSFELRPAEFDTLELPIPTDILVYTQEEWQAMKPKNRFILQLAETAVWVYTRKIKPHEANP